jgi:hypothetical protein
MMTSNNDDDLPLLIDDLYRMTFGPPVPGWKYSNKKMRQQLFMPARRFVLDKAMSAFLADVAFAVCNKRSSRLSLKAMDFARKSARLPHDMTWIEYDIQSYDKRETELAGELINFEARKSDVWLREGWMLNGFQQYDQEFRVHVFRSLVRDGVPVVWASPFSVNWRTDETDVAFFKIDQMTEQHLQTFMADVVLGARGWATHSRALRVGCAELINLPDDLEAAWAKGTVTAGEIGPHFGVMIGLMRRVWTLLATINDLPVMFTQPRRLAHGFRARAQCRRFLEHKVITLTVPVAEYRQVARATVAQAKRRAHMVRGHWRKDWRHPDLRIWIKEHVRGEVKLGLVTHDYRVTHCR